LHAFLPLAASKGELNSLAAACFVIHFIWAGIVFIAYGL
jgi:hypothetical protein